MLCVTRLGVILEPSQTMMNSFYKYIFLTIPIFLNFSIVKGQNMQSTNFSTPECLVLQICPQELAGDAEVNGKKYKRTAAFIFLPNSKPGETLSCPLNYFQESSSIPEKWIKNDAGEKLTLNSIDKLNKVVITKLNNGVEEKINIPDEIPHKLFDYFNFDIENNLNKYQGFDCYALQSLLRNVKFFPQKPSWDYKEANPNIGDVVILSTDEKLPDSIKHWAIYLGDDFYLSKFGKSGEGAQSQITIMNLEGMKLLYDCKFSFSAYPKKDKEAWNGYKQ